jgi:hypothetical protein
MEQQIQVVEEVEVDFLAYLMEYQDQVVQVLLLFATQHLKHHQQ